MTTPTPAQADEKALWARYVPEWGCMKLCAKSDFGAVEYRLAALRPEGEAVAEPRAWIANDPDGGPYLTWSAEAAAHYPNPEPLFASPPAPAGVKVKALEWLECKALSGFTKLVGRDCFGNEFARLDIRNQTRAEIDEFKRERQADYEARILSALLSPAEAQAATPAEALPSQTSGAEAITARYTNWQGVTAERTFIPHRVFFGSNEWHPEPQVLIEATDCEKGALRTFAAAGFALAKPASEPAGGGVDREWLKTEIDAIDTWYRGEPSYLRDAYWMKEQVLKLLDNPAALSSPASSSPAEAEALPAGVDAVERAAKIAEAQVADAVGDDDAAKAYRMACYDCAEAIRALSPAPAQAGSAGAPSNGSAPAGEERRRDDPFRPAVDVDADDDYYPSREED